MKTTVKLGQFLRLTVEPTPGGEVRVGLHTDVQTKAVFELDENQAGAFIFGLEAAFDAMGMAAQRADFVGQIGATA